MSGHAEEKAWKAAGESEKPFYKQAGGGGIKGQIANRATKEKRAAPFYKVCLLFCFNRSVTVLIIGFQILTGMPIAVDAFRYGKIPDITAYFLTHAHSDHYTNLSKGWKNGMIYCSETTAKLVQHMLGVSPSFVCGLPFDIPYEIPDTGGVMVSRFDRTIRIYLTLSRTGHLSPCQPLSCKYLSIDPVCDNEQETDLYTGKLRLPVRREAEHQRTALIWDPPPLPQLDTPLQISSLW